jgi:fumarate reductase flavoprotein subunit
VAKLPNRSRRRALQTLAAAAVFPAAHRSRAADRQQWDLVIVGAGTAGLPAALFAADRGLRVALLEITSQIGGTLWMSGGQMSAAGTRRQRMLGIDDSAEQHLRDVMRISQGSADAALVRRAVAEAGPTLDWLDDSGFEFGAEFPVAATGHEPYSQPRVWGGPERGLSILRILESQLAASPRKPSIVFDFAVEELLLESTGSVTGVAGRESAGGTRRVFRAPNVLLASGGYASNPALFERVNGLPQYKAAGWPANTGIGFDLALSAGGFTRGERNYLCDFGSIPGGVVPPSPELARSIHHPQRRMPWEIAVNANGRRFIVEDDPSVDTRERALVQQPHHRYWLVFDERILAEAPPLVRTAPPAEQRDWTREELRNAFGTIDSFVRADSIEELAARSGIEPVGLQQTVIEYNRAVDTHVDPMGRKHLPRPIGTPPFYSIRHQGGTLIAVGGVAVDDSLRVLRRSGESIPGLYAAGEILGNGSLSGRAFCSGMSVTPALALGRWLGRTLPSRT